MVVLRRQGEQEAYALQRVNQVRNFAATRDFTRSQAAEAAVAALPAVASPAPPTAGDRLRDSFGAVSVRDDERIAE